MFKIQDTLTAAEILSRLPSSLDILLFECLLLDCICEEEGDLAKS